ncbi:hypothetical protein CGLO_04079 [Colletotrichum gloeosporioides Cg-14]|uniref:Uncharacterized protein n=1 Tax=Colletotrichum gloeosporioides (strain Cg-14) TaxID=1237896 RepID=T0KTI7_COLGC|nr:hypothetical protein CGLO_04079 [Colletotrichum gloeosporioides Cg-14]
MDMTEDVEEELEEFSRLRRIGHFKAARRYFEEHLESCIDNAYVLDQYSQFLLEISDVHTLTKLAREYPAGDGQKALQCLTNNLRVVKTSLEASTEEYTAEEYGQLYAHLQHEDRIWDFRDLCYGLLAVKSLEGTIHCLFNKYLTTDNENAEDVIQVVQHHWEIAAGDEVTSLALLDIFTLFTMWALDAASTYYDDDSADNSEELQTAKMYLKVAHHYATEVLRQNPLNLKSRPYLQWVIAKVLVERNTDAAASWGQDALTRYLSNLRGEAQPTTNALPVRRHFTEISEDFEHGRKHTLGSDSGKMTEGSKDMEDIIDLVDDRDKQRREEVKNDDSDVGEIEVENFESHVSGEKRNQEDVQSTDSQVGNHADSTYEPPSSRPPFF